MCKGTASPFAIVRSASPHHHAASMPRVLDWAVMPDDRLHGLGGGDRQPAALLAECPAPRHHGNGPSRNSSPSKVTIYGCSIRCGIRGRTGEYRGLLDESIGPKSSEVRSKLVHDALTRRHIGSWAHASTVEGQALVHFRAGQAKSCAYKLRNSGAGTARRRPAHPDQTGDSMYPTAATLHGSPCATYLASSAPVRPS
jgi:hypothetical protein